MHRIDTDDAAPGGLFQEGVPETGQRATAVSADWLNAVQEEICAVLTAASVTPSKPNNAQLLAAISALITSALPSLTPYVKTDGTRAMTGALTLAGNASSALHAVPKQQLDAAVAAVYAVPTGAVVAFAMSGVPSGWLECDGSAVSRSTYAALFSAVGTTYGVGDGSSTFNLPDLRGEFVRGWDHGRGVDSGRSIGSAQAADLASHSHNITTVNNQESTDLGNVAESGGTTDLSTTRISTSATGGSETRPRNVALMYCIRT